MRALSETATDADRIAFYSKKFTIAFGDEIKLTADCGPEILKAIINALDEIIENI